MPTPQTGQVLRKFYGTAGGPSGRGASRSSQHRPGDSCKPNGGQGMGRKHDGSG